MLPRSILIKTTTTKRFVLTELINKMLSSYPPSPQGSYCPTKTVQQLLKNSIVYLEEYLIRLFLIIVYSGSYYNDVVPSDMAFAV